MKNDPLFGPAFPEAGWVPAPRYLLRRARVLSLASSLPPGRLLEVGPGAGVLLMELADRGFRCEALELSAEAREFAQQLQRAAQRDLPIHATEQPGWDGAFDAVCAFDVLEHVEDDRGALSAWHRWLKPGGSLLLSVPARMSLWTAGDEWAGHFRRYERDGLVQLLQSVGFELERFECYGFPLANVSEKVSARAYRRTLRTGGDASSARKANNDRSGIDRRPVMGLFPWMSSPPGRLAMRMAIRAQAATLDRDWGSGYVLKATRP